MSGRHTALIVEDEPEMAAELADLLRSLGHDHVHAETLADAMERISEGSFCYALVDLQIKADSQSIKPRVESGMSVLREIRRRFPGRGANDKHLMPVIVVSGHGRESQTMVGAFQNAADDFILKPLSTDDQDVGARIRRCLELAGRNDHDACEACACAAAPAPAEKQYNGAAFGKELRSDDVIASRLSLPDSCLLATIPAPATADVELGDPIDTELPASQQVALVGAPLLRRPIRFAIDRSQSVVRFDEGVEIKGTAFRLVAALLPAFLDGLKAQRGIDCFEFMRADILAGSLDIQQQTLRQAVHRLRRTLEQQFERAFRIAISEDDVIENRGWRGYRLNPRLQLVSTLTQAADQ